MELLDLLAEVPLESQHLPGWFIRPLGFLGLKPGAPSEHGFFHLLGNDGSHFAQVFPNGVDLDRFAIAMRAAHRSKRDPVVLMVGRLDNTKDHETLVDGISILHKRGLPARLRIAGNGANREMLAKRANASGIGQAVKFLGVRSDIPDLLRTADVFAFSVRSEEGLGIALVEAMASGVPVVATDVGACREVLDGGSCGLLVKPGDPEALADAIGELIGQPERAADRAQRARARVEDVYDRRVMARRYAELCGVL